MWFKGTIPKHTSLCGLHTWTCFVQGRLLKWGITDNSLCCLCAMAKENMDYLFFWCEVSDHIWDLELKRLDYNSIYFVTWIAFLDWLSMKDVNVPRVLKSHSLPRNLWDSVRNKRIHCLIVLRVLPEKPYWATLRRHIFIWCKRWLWMSNSRITIKGMFWSKLVFISFCQSFTSQKYLPFETFTNKNEILILAEENIVSFPTTFLSICTKHSVTHEIQSPTRILLDIYVLLICNIRGY